MERERQRRLHVENRLAELRAKYGHEDVWLAEMDAASDRPRGGVDLDQPAVASATVRDPTTPAAQVDSPPVIDVSHFDV